MPTGIHGLTKSITEFRKHLEELGFLVFLKLSMRELTLQQVLKRFNTFLKILMHLKCYKKPVNWIQQKMYYSQA